MKAIVQERFGSPDVLQFLDTDRPEIGADDVLVRVHAAALNPYDWHIVRGDPYVARLMGEAGLPRPSPNTRTAGAAGPGTSKAAGANGPGLHPGAGGPGGFQGPPAGAAPPPPDRGGAKP